MTGKRLDVLGVLERRRLDLRGIVVAPDHHRRAFPASRSERKSWPAGASRAAVHALERADRRRAHVQVLAVVVVEDHGLDDVDADTVRDGVLQDRQAIRVQPVARTSAACTRSSAAGSARWPSPGRLDRLVAPVDAAARPSERPSMSMSSRLTSYVVMTFSYAAAILLTSWHESPISRVVLISRPAAERRRDVAAHGPQLGDVRYVCAGSDLSGCCRRSKRACTSVRPSVSRNASVK